MHPRLCDPGCRFFRVLFVGAFWKLHKGSLHQGILGTWVLFRGSGPSAPVCQLLMYNVCLDLSYSRYMQMNIDSFYALLRVPDRRAPPDFSHRFPLQSPTRIYYSSIFLAFLRMAAERQRWHCFHLWDLN